MIGYLFWKGNRPTQLRVNKTYTKSVNIFRGLRQGCILLSILFNFYGEKIMPEAKLGIRGVVINREKITNIRYADDTVLLEQTEKNYKMCK